MAIQVEPLKALVSDIFRRVGCPEDEAGRIAHYLTRANLTGHDSHGVIRVPRYVTWVNEGRVFPGKHIEIALDTGSITVVEGGFGFGQTIGPESAQLGIKKAKNHGISVIAIRNSGHLGRIGDYAEMAIEAGLVSVHFVNAFSSRIVAPFGARERRCATNPIAIGSPTGDGRQFILDFATSMVAEGKVLVAQQGGKPVPEGALVDGEGNLTNDPEALYGEVQSGGYPDPNLGAGALRAFGEHKGSGLSLACELLGGALTGSGANTPEGGRFRNGMLSFYLDPTVFDTKDNYRGEASTFLDWIRSSTAIDEDQGVLVPGDKERKLTAERTTAGLPLSDQTWNAIRATAVDVGVNASLIDNVEKS